MESSRNGTGMGRDKGTGREGDGTGLGNLKDSGIRPEKHRKLFRKKAESFKFQCQDGTGNDGIPPLDYTHSEVGIYERKIVRESVRNTLFDQEKQ